MSKRSWIPLCAASWLIWLLSACMFSGPRNLVARPLDTPSSSGRDTECKSVSIRLAAPKNFVVNRVVEILASRIQERSGVRPTFNGKADCSVELNVQKGIGSEGFRIEDVSPGKVRILGDDSRGLLYGVGKFLRSNAYHQGSFTLGNWRGTSVPEEPFRGMYFATHFFNFYHEAPIENVQRYVEDLGLWGYNAIIVWYDMHHFEGMQDPAAQTMIKRLNVILRTAKNVGLGAGLTLIANEAYANSPVALRADWTAGHDGYFSEPAGHYHVELCPYKPGAKELLLKWREETFQAFNDVGLDYVVIWPYDQGGCTCSQCKPWGTNGFLMMAEPIAELARRDFPGCKVILSAWYFDKFTSGEWGGLERKFGEERPKWVDYMMADDAGVRRYSGNPPEHRVPGGFCLLSFPEISMWGAGPWGGFGANPLPAHHQKLWNVGKDSLAGGFPYSEGIFEDLNKVLFAQFYWRKDTPANSIVDEYIAYEFSPKVVAPVRRAVEILETNYPRRAENLEKGEPVRFVLQHSSGAEEALNLIRQADKDLSPGARGSWRWRILYLRALIDDELVKNDFQVSSHCEEALHELTNIYYAEKAIYAVSPPTKEAIARFRRNEQ